MSVRFFFNIFLFFLPFIPRINTKQGEAAYKLGLDIFKLHIREQLGLDSIKIAAILVYT